MSQSGLRPTHPVTVVNEYGEQSEQQIPGEFPLTIRIDDTEIVTLMTLGSQPEALTLGYVRNQKLIESNRRLAGKAQSQNRHKRLWSGHDFQLHNRQALRSSAS